MDYPAERVGFEPTRLSPTAFRERHLQPLGHLSSASLNFEPPMKRFHYAWVVVAVTFLALLAAQAVRAAPGVIITSLESEFGWSRTAISFAISLSIFTFGLGGPLGGTIIDRYGLRLVMLVGDLVILGGLVGLIFVRDLWQMYVLWGLPIGIGTGMVD